MWAMSMLQVMWELLRDEDKRHTLNDPNMMDGNIYRIFCMSHLLTPDEHDRLLIWVNSNVLMWDIIINNLRAKDNVWGH